MSRAKSCPSQLNRGSGWMTAIRTDDGRREWLRLGRKADVSLTKKVIIDPFNLHGAAYADPDIELDHKLS